ncbi:MAG: BspA family leucine-rich repeat surface protein [Tenericutes bacterium]|nr:BspA family leucine-rich repeat surface protein [Mycoplasmatota bacterium]
MNKIDYIFKNKMFVLVLICLIGIILNFSYSNFFVLSNNHKVAEMYVGELSYTININGNNTNFVSIPNGTSDITLLISSKNEIITKYKLGYIIDNNNSNYSIYYYDDTSYSTPSGSITSNGNKSIKLRITNNSSAALKFTFKVFGGYDYNDLNSIVLSGGYMQITEVVPDACVFTGNLVAGATYSYGQYTYIYKMYNYYNVDEDSYQLKSFSDDGWSVILTDKDSTAPVTSEICSSINDKPIVSTSAMFANSKAISISYKEFDTSNVTDMNCMFCNTSFTDISSLVFNTSKVIDMSYMFYNSKYTDKLYLTYFDTHNVTDMSYMFYGSAASDINVTNFSFYDIVDMSYMFANSTTQYVYFISDIPDGSILNNMFENRTIDTVFVPSTVINSDFTQDITKYPDTMRITVIV